MFDTENSGHIDHSELKVAMRALGIEVDPDEVKDYKNEVGKDGSGVVDWNEFLKIMRKKILDLNPEEEIQKAFQMFTYDKKSKS